MKKAMICLRLLLVVNIVLNDEKNTALYEQYKELASHETSILFGGRLGEYKYYDMDKVIASALEKSKEI